MKPAWDQLGDEYAASSSVVIADVDCTNSESEKVCNDFGIQGYPTIKYFKDGDTSGQDYRGGRDFDSLNTFVKDTLEIKCNVEDPAECTDKEKSYIEKMKAKTSEDRAKELKRLDGMKSNAMKAELKAWLSQRLHILKSLDPNEEL